MMLDAVLLALPGLAAGAPLQAATDIAIVPGLRLAPSGGVKVTNPETGFQLRLTGSADYAVIKYVNDKDGNNKGCSYRPSGMLLADQACIQPVSLALTGLHKPTHSYSLKGACSSSTPRATNPGTQGWPPPSLRRRPRRWQ